MREMERETNDIRMQRSQEHYQTLKNQNSNGELDGLKDTIEDLRDTIQDLSHNQQRTLNANRDDQFRTNYHRSSKRFAEDVDLEKPISLHRSADRNKQSL